MLLYQPAHLSNKQKGKRAKGLITFQAMDEKLFKVKVDLITFKHKVWNKNNSNNKGNTDV